MDIAAYIHSGILETYCLGLASPQEEREVAAYAKLYPAIQNEIDVINSLLEEYAMANRVEPPAGNRTKLLLALYQQLSGSGKVYPPLVKEHTTANDFSKWMADKDIPSPGEDYDNLWVHELPSTGTVMNAMVWAKKGFDLEEHSTCNEFVAILEGHCDMYFDGEKKHYEAGEIIRIPPMMPHYAVITSAKPMIAIVQRQLIAA